MATAKKTTAKKSVTKKAVAKKTTAKKAVAKKAVAKKAVAKKSTAVKKSTAKKAVAKKPTVKKATPVKKSATKKTVKKATPVKRAPRKVVDLTAGIPEVPFSGVPSRPSPSTSTISETPHIDAAIISEKKQGNGLLWFAVLALISSVVYFISQQSSSENTNTSAPAPVASETPSAAPSDSVTSEPTDSATIKPAESTKPQSTNSPAASSGTLTAQSSFLYTSTGIKISWSTTGFNEYQAVTLSASEDGSPFTLFASGGSTEQSFDVIKVDTVGKTTFKVTLTTSDGKKVSAPALTIRGRFEK